MAVLMVGLCCVLGFDQFSELTKPLKNAKEKVAVEKISIAENTTKPLTEEDKFLKAEIAKHGSTTVDFRHGKQVTIQGKKYDIAFEKFNTKINPSKIVYTSDKGDSFEYDIKTGELCNVTIKSNIVEKTNESIDMATAHKIALEYFPNDCDINEYTNTKLIESKDGYAIWYTKYIGQYMTTDAFCVKVGFDGSLVYINDATNVFDGKTIDFNEDFVTAKIQDFLNQKEGLEISNAVILVEDDVVCVDCSCNYISGDSSTSAFHVSIPLE